MGDEMKRLFITDENGEPVWRGETRPEAQRWLKTEATPGCYNIMAHIEMGVLVEPPKRVFGNHVVVGQKVSQRVKSGKPRKQRVKKAKADHVPANDVDPDEDNQSASV